MKFLKKSLNGLYIFHIAEEKFSNLKTGQKKLSKN